MKKTHYYLVDTTTVTPGAAVSELQFHIINEDPFDVHGLEVRFKKIAMLNQFNSVIYFDGFICTPVTQSTSIFLNHAIISGFR